MKWSTRIWILLAGIAVALIILFTVTGWNGFTNTALEAGKSPVLPEKASVVLEKILNEGLRLVRYEGSR